MKSTYDVEQLKEIIEKEDKKTYSFYMYYDENTGFIYKIEILKNSENYIRSSFIKRKYLIILLSFIFVLLIILGHYIFVSITYVPRAEILMENSIEENFIKENNTI